MKKNTILIGLISTITILIVISFNLVSGIKQEVRAIEDHEKGIPHSENRIKKDIVPEIKNTEVKELLPIYKDKAIMTISAYSPRECETDSTPFITANNTRVFEGGMAVSRDVLNELGWELGDRVHIPALDRTFTINDKMNKRWKLRADVFFFNTKKALLFGVKKGVTVYLIKNSEDA